ncbi:MAG: class I SAM-dependent methyltransferase [Gemmatimonadota bacterium]|nr:class I SAM-dependent methyltransferase [Gemmatimonadota bacterium]
MTDLQQQFGHIDIYLFDQLLRGNIAAGMRILDAGCGSGRNIHYLLQAGFEVFGVDADANAIDIARALAAELSPSLPRENFRVESVQLMTFPALFADVVLSSAVLHFAADESQFIEMLEGSWRVLKRGGLFFCRLASSIGMENQVQRISGRRFALPDGSERFLVDAEMLLRLGEKLGGELVDPIKTTVVQGQRCMTTWVLRKLG